MLPIVLGVLDSGSIGVNSDIVGTEIFVRLFVSTNGQNQKYDRHTNIGMLICKHRRTKRRRKTQIKAEQHRTETDQHRTETKKHRTKNKKYRIET